MRTYRTPKIEKWRNSLLDWGIGKIIVLNQLEQEYIICDIICYKEGIILLMAFKILFYEKENNQIPVKIFLESLSKKQGAKAYWSIELLEKFGINLTMPHVKPMKGRYKGLWELRVKFASDISRIFYFMPVGDTFVLLHGFVKKTDDTPPEELEIAKRYMDEYRKDD